MTRGRWRALVFRRAFRGLSPVMDARGGASHRAQLLREVSGEVVEVGAGTGATFPHYGSRVTHVVAVEPDSELRAVASSVALGTAIPIDVVDGTADKLPVAATSCDWVVCSLVLCSVPSQGSALAEIMRVLKPGGRLAFYEHVRSDSRLIGVVEDVLTPAWSAVAGGCHPNRSTLESLVAAGFEIEDVSRFGFSPHPISPQVAHISGTARVPLAEMGPSDSNLDRQ